ncbi:MAG: hypothetical protein D6737_02485 [Chloroflexi bacterium]|nr:MAG: hypothetical protein CUN54_03150 [Phototrophicales bacterium]RMF82301.1 MAG: hypothetical protein D6737_02485 [Chloroflexota bacterium]
MRGRVLILIALIILLVAVLVAFLVLGGDNGDTTSETANVPPAGNGNAPSSQVVQPTPPRLVNIVVALQQLPRGFQFPSNIDELFDENGEPTIVALRAWPEEAVPVNAIRESGEGLEGVLNKIVRTDISREGPVLTTMLVDNLNQIAATGSDAAAILPPNLVAVSIPIDRLTGVAFAIQDGDRVDVIMSMLFVDVDEAFQSISPNRVTLFQLTEEGIEVQQGIEGRVDTFPTFGAVIVGPSERQRPRLVTQRTIQDAFVVHVGEFPLDGQFIGVVPTPTTPPEAQAQQPQGQEGPPPSPTPIPRPDIITLGVTPQNAVALTWAVEARIPVSLALRSATDTSRLPTTAVTLDVLINEFGIEVPGKRPFTVEPAIRSIRQLLNENEFQISSGGENAGQ